MASWDIGRIARHLCTTRAQVRRDFPNKTLDAIEAAIRQGEAVHEGEIRFAVEGGLDGLPLWRGQSARERAMELFAQLNVWDTEHNNGLLIYLLLADRAVEIVADRGIQARVSPSEWADVCNRMKEQFAASNFEQGAIDGIRAVTQHLIAHFPATRRAGDATNELSDRPVIL